jgi:two-component system nitrogen regulation response regulator GlnG
MTDSNGSFKLLVIDDDADLRYSLKRVLSGKDYTVLEAESGEAGIKMAAAEKPQVILLDNRMPGMTGIETLQHLRGENPNAMIILMTAFGTTQTTIEAMKFGAFDYIMKPFDPKQILGLTEAALAASSDLDKASASMGGDADSMVSAEDLEGGIIGSSGAMQAVFKTIGQVAASDATVMVTGESGTGKELIARAIHQNSLRANKPYIAVNCAAIAENLIESELFGHEKGAFTGATQQHVGKFERCDGGTIFLDEIGDMALATQTKILRALQEGEIQRVGGSETIKVDVRMLAATNKPLEKMVAEKTFREDLYYRLNVVRVPLPALRERMEDVPSLVDYMLKRLARDSKTESKQISPEALGVLEAYDWPGNVRELENLIYRSAVMAQGEAILLKDLPEEVVGNAGKASIGKTDSGASEDVEASGDALDAAYAELRAENDADLLQAAEREMIRRVLVETKGETGAAAKILGMTPATLRKRIERYGLRE